MFDHPKYVVIEDRTCEVPIILSCITDHATVVGQYKVVSAGFVSLGINAHRITASCWGESTSLKGIKSRGEEDARLIERMLNEE